MTVNGKIIKRWDEKVNRGDLMQIDRWDGISPLIIECKEFVTILLYKPKWYVCSDIDEWWHKSYNTLLTQCPYWKTLHVAGRLDQDTTWLVVCTNNGDLNHRIISPKHKLIKTYIVQCETVITDYMIDMLKQGVKLDDGYITLPADLVKTEGDDREIILRIVEWKYHQVKRMLEAVWNKVIKLHRSAIGDRNLQDLKEWEWRYL